MSFIKIMILIYQIEWIENEWWFFSWMIVTCIPCIHDMIFMQFFILMKYLSHHPIISFQYSSSDDMNAWDIHEFILMYTNEKLWSCMVGYNLTKLIPSWYETFMICNDACNTYAF